MVSSKIKIRLLQQKENVTGIFFSILWSSAAIATKIGITSTSPLTLAVIRFLIAGILTILVLQLFYKEKLPSKSDWLKITIFALLNISICLGCIFAATEFVSAGLINLFLAINPLLITLFSALMLKRKIYKYELIGFLICFLGLLIACFPALKHSKSSLTGIILLGIGMSSYSIGSVYFKKIELKLSNRSINGWQTLIGGFFLIPVAFFMNKKTITFDQNFYFSLFWLTIVISIFGMLLWLNLLKKDTLKASKWLFLSPIFGYLLSYLILNEPITLYALVGTVFVIYGLKLSK